MTDNFSVYLRVRYAECDAQKVVFNAKYAEYADVAATEFTRAIWGDYSTLLESGIDNQVVSLTIDWLAPAIFDDVLQIEVATHHIGNTSYSLDMQVKRDNGAEEQAKLLAKIRLTYVMVSTTTYQKMPIPDALKEALEAGAVGIVIDQSGKQRETI